MTRKIAIRWMTGAASLVALLAGPSPGDASPGTVPAVGDTTPPSGSLLSWSHNATEYRGQVGRRISFTCSPGGSLASVWGTDVYSDDSSICTAAVHAGVISRDRGGAVTIEIRPGLGEYPASTRNGISTSRWGSWSGSYAFVGGLLSNPTIDWGTNAVLYRGQVGQQHSFTCPAGGTARTIWGTGLYTDDSSICTAAAHAGILTLGTGGPVTIEMRPGQTSYDASTHNGIASRGYGSWTGSYVIVGAPQPRDVRTPSTGRSWSGTITSSDRRREDGSWYDVYPVHLQLGETVVITLNSSDFDAYLTVVSPTGVQTNDDDSGEGTNSQVRLTVDRAGMWEIWANTYESGQTGSYTLTVDRSTGATPPPATAPVPTTPVTPPSAPTTPVTPPSGAAVAAPTNASYRAGEAIVVRFQGFPGNSGDWITVVAADRPDNQFGQWFYLGSRREGTLNFNGLAAGTYEVRSYFNWPAGGYTVQTRQRFTVAP